MRSDIGEIDTVSLMFEAARSYLGGAKIIIASDGIGDDQGVRVPTLPVTTSLVLAIEIQLKALLLANSIERPKGDGHDLLLLFNALPSTVQSEFSEFQTKYTDLDGKDFRQLITDERGTFKTWRYPYEKPVLETQPAPLYGVALALSDYLVSNLKIERSENGWVRKRSGGRIWLRVLTALVFVGIASATILSLSANPSLKWFDWVAAAPIIYIFLSLAIFRSDSALFEELDSTLTRVKRLFGLS